jgi:hypothetical protein
MKMNNKDTAAAAVRLNKEGHRGEGEAVERVTVATATVLNSAEVVTAGPAAEGMEPDLATVLSATARLGVAGFSLKVDQRFLEDRGYGGNSNSVEDKLQWSKEQQDTAAAAAEYWFLSTEEV